VNPFGLPFSFLEALARGIRLVEIDPADDPWISNSLAIAPGQLLMPAGATNRTLDALPRHGVTWTTIPTRRCTRTAAAFIARPRPCAATRSEASCAAG